MTWQFQVFLLTAATGGFLFIAFRSEWTFQWPLWGRCLLGLLVIAGMVWVAWAPVRDQYAKDSRLQQDGSEIDQLARYKEHDQSVQKIVDQYARLKKAESIYEFYAGRLSGEQRDAIDRQEVDDLTAVLRNYEAIATPVGDGLRVRIGMNTFRVIFPTPMRIIPKVTITGLPPGSKATIADPSTIGFTVVFTPLSIPIEHFGMFASADF